MSDTAGSMGRGVSATAVGLILVVSAYATLPAGFASGIQQGLSIPDDFMAWLFGDYVLGLSILPLLGKRVVTRWGAKRTLLTAAMGFACAGLLGASATGREVLFAARWLQGFFGMLLIVASASVLSVIRPPTSSARRTMEIGAILVGGLFLGVLMGYAAAPDMQWRWMFLPGIVAALAVLTLAGAVPIADSRRAGESPSLLAVVLATASLHCLVYGIIDGVTQGWWHPSTIALLFCAPLVLIVARAASRVT
ncbi:MFS transporter [Streptomyces sp. NPDC059479]|uniref:MFS transporter n=1 Tax=Streptomyces sp. NPDC059479 TaxID=3346848 RepID=UPI0036B55AA5